MGRLAVTLKETLHFTQRQGAFETRVRLCLGPIKLRLNATYVHIKQE